MGLSVIRLQPGEDVTPYIGSYRKVVTERGIEDTGIK
jgi:hypothetical protein